MKLSDFEKQIADDLINLMAKKGLKWTQAWQRDRPACNGITGHVYRGANVLSTWIWLMKNEQSDPRFIPRFHVFNKKDPEANVGKVKKGSKAIPIVFYSQAKDKEDDSKTYRFAKIYHVFHVSQIDDLDESRLVQPSPDPAPEEKIERLNAIDEWVANTKIEVKEDTGDNRAFYNPTLDYVNMPADELFYSVEDYYTVLMHELGHATGAEHRLDRQVKNAHGSPDYAFEELVAELTSVLLCTDHGIQVGINEQNAAYIKSWIQRLNDDPKFIFDAMRKASAAQLFLNELQPQHQSEAA